MYLSLISPYNCWRCHLTFVSICYRLQILLLFLLSLSLSLPLSFPSSAFLFLLLFIFLSLALSRTLFLSLFPLLQVSVFSLIFFWKLPQSCSVCSRRTWKLFLSSNCLSRKWCKNYLTFSDFAVSLLKTSSLLHKHHDHHEQPQKNHCTTC